MSLARMRRWMRQAGRLRRKNATRDAYQVALGSSGRKQHRCLRPGGYTRGVPPCSYEGLSGFLAVDAVALRAHCMETGDRSWNQFFACTKPFTFGDMARGPVSWTQNRK